MLALTDNISTDLKKHIESQNLLVNNVFRYGSDRWAEMIREARALYVQGLLDDLDIDDYALLESNAGEFAFIDDRRVLLDCPEPIHEQPGQFEVYIATPAGTQRIQFEAEPLVTT
jgi:hypothetical protein